MISPDHVHLLATYNQWMNQKLYAICATLSDAQRKADQQAFFKSIHNTLNHIMLADKVWSSRFTGESFSVTGLDQILFDDFSALRAERELLDARILDWAAQLKPAALEAELVYRSTIMPGTRRCKLWILVTHFFNHQTHHRGQITTLLSQLGIDPGVTDLIGMPGVIQID